MTFTSLDFETANPSRVSICAAGLAVFENGQLTESPYWLVRPDMRIPCFSFILLLLLFCSGCETDKMPSQTGTWIGVAKPVTLYDAKRLPHEVLQLVLQEGPKIDNGSLKGLFLFPKAVIVDKRNYTVDMEKYDGHKLKISGHIVISSAIDRNDKCELMWTTPKLDYEHMNPPAIIRTKRIEIID